MAPDNRFEGTTRFAGGPLNVSGRQKAPEIQSLAMLLATLLSVASCSQPALRDYRKDHPPVVDEEMVQWNGRPAAELVKQWGAPKSMTKLEEQRLEYRYPRPDIDSSCVHFWIMNRQNFIVGHRYEGLCKS